MKRWQRAGFALGAAFAVAAVVAGTGVAGGSTAETPAEPRDTPASRPEQPGAGATSTGTPGTASSYGTEERTREASPAPMPTGPTGP